MALPLILPFQLLDYVVRIRDLLRFNDLIGLEILLEELYGILPLAPHTGREPIYHKLRG